MSALSPAREARASVPPLRIFDSNRSGDDLSLGLRAAWQKHVLPRLDDLAPSTIAVYDAAFAAWERITGDPPLGQIDGHTLVEFRKLRKLDHWRGRPISPNTVNQNLRQLHAALSDLGPKRTDDDLAAQLIEHVPHVRLLPEQMRAKRIASADELARLFVACEIARWPRDRSCPPYKLWRALIGCAINWGMRTCDLMAFSPAMIEDGAADWFERRVLRFVPRKTCARKPDPLDIPVNDFVWRLLLGVKVAGEKPFGWLDRERRWPSVKRWWDRINLQARIPLSRKVHFSDLRKTSNVLYESLEAGTGRWILGHAPRDVNSKYYMDVPREKIVQAVERFVQPPGFNCDDAQLRLF